jgi:histidinol-phosphate aminotransferase
VKEFWSKRIVGITPYTPGEQPKNRKFIKLNTNENPYGPSPKVVEAIRQETGDALRLYPDPDGTMLLQAAAEQFGLTTEEIFVGNGSDEVLAFAFQAFFDQGSTITFPDITYTFYPVYADLFGIGYDRIPLEEDFSVPVERFLGGNDGVVICNPNAPTGVELPLSAIRRIIEGNPDVVVIVDEAYIDFGGTSALSLIREYPNVLVVQTMSKSRSLAGLRVGMAFGCPNLIAAMNAVKNSINSYTLDRLAIVGGTAALQDTAYFQETTQKVIATRERTANALRGLGFQVPESRSNFLFVHHPAVPAKYLMAQLRERGILVRYFDKPRINDHLRISIGTDEEMDALLAALTELVADHLK